MKTDMTNRIGRSDVFGCQIGWKVLKFNVIFQRMEGLLLTFMLRVCKERPTYFLRVFMKRLKASERISDHFTFQGPFVLVKGKFVFIRHSN